MRLRIVSQDGFGQPQLYDADTMANLNGLMATRITIDYAGDQLPTADIEVIQPAVDVLVEEGRARLYTTILGCAYELVPVDKETKP